MRRSLEVSGSLGNGVYSAQLAPVFSLIQNRLRLIPAVNASAGGFQVIENVKLRPLLYRGQHGDIRGHILGVAAYGVPIRNQNLPCPAVMLLGENGDGPLSPNPGISPTT